MDFKGIAALVIDVDGVLTDGSLLYGAHGEEIKKFDIKDGTGIRLFLSAHLEFAVITGRDSAALDYRLKELGVVNFYKNIRNKERTLKAYGIQTGIALSKICFIGDDIIDIPALKIVGYPICVADSADEVKGYADYITEKRGGYGAVREVINLILKSKKLWDITLNRYLNR